MCVLVPFKILSCGDKKQLTSFRSGLSDFRGVSHRQLSGHIGVGGGGQWETVPPPPPKKKKKKKKMDAKNAGKIREEIWQNACLKNSGENSGKKWSKKIKKRQQNNSGKIRAKIWAKSGGENIKKRPGKKNKNRANSLEENGKLIVFLSQ